MTVILTVVDEILPNGEPALHQYQVKTLEGLRDVVKGLEKMPDSTIIFGDKEMAEINVLVQALTSHEMNLQKLRGDLGQRLKGEEPTASYVPALKDATAKVDIKPPTKSLNTTPPK